MFKEFFERRRIERVFREVVDPDVISERLKAEGLDLDNFKEGTIEYILVIAGGATPKEINANIASVCSIAHEHKAMHFTILGPLVALGNSPWNGQPLDRLKLVEELRQKLGHGIKIVHGAAAGHWGLLGSADNAISYSFLIPNFPFILGLFRELNDGEIREFPQSEES